MLKISGCAFSISSSNTTEYGLRLHLFGELSALFVAPRSREASRSSFDDALCFSMYSDMSKLDESRSSLPNRNLRERPCASSGLADAGGAEEHEAEPTGRFGSLQPRS